MAPIASHYRSAFTSILLNNLISAHSLNSNCEKDTATALLTDINHYVSGVGSSNIDDDDNIIFEPESIDFKFHEREPMYSISSESLSSLCGTVCKKILRTTNCSNCKMKIQAAGLAAKGVISNDNQKTILVYPSQSFITNFKILFAYAKMCIPHFCHEKFLKTKILRNLKNNETINLLEVGCPIHNSNILSTLTDLTVTYCLTDFCKEVNKLLSGKVTTLPVNYTFVHANALEFNLQRKKIGKYSDKFLP